MKRSELFIKAIKEAVKSPYYWNSEHLPLQRLLFQKGYNVQRIRVFPKGSTTNGMEEFHHLAELAPIDYFCAIVDQYPSDKMYRIQMDVEGKMVKREVTELELNCDYEHPGYHHDESDVEYYGFDKVTA